MAATKGNEWWRKAINPGRKPFYSKAEELMIDVADYLETTDSKVWEREDWVGKDATSVTREYKVPYTISGFCIHIGASRQWWNSFKKDCTEGSKQEFLEVITRIEDIFFTQKFEGAVIGLFKENIISRDLGLVDKKEIEDKSKKKTTIKVNIVRPGQKPPEK